MILLMRLKLEWMHYYIIWPSLAVVCMGFGMLSAGYKDVALEDAKDVATIHAIIEYVPPQQAIHALTEIKI